MDNKMKKDFVAKIGNMFNGDEQILDLSKQEDLNKYIDAVESLRNNQSMKTLYNIFDTEESWNKLMDDLKTEGYRIYAEHHKNDTPKVCACDNKCASTCSEKKVVDNTDECDEFLPTEDVEINGIAVILDNKHYPKYMGKVIAKSTSSVTLTNVVEFISDDGIEMHKLGNETMMFSLSYWIVDEPVNDELVEYYKTVGTVDKKKPSDTIDKDTKQNFKNYINKYITETFNGKLPCDDFADQLLEYSCWLFQI